MQRMRRRVHLLDARRRAFGERLHVLLRVGVEVLLPHEGQNADGDERRHCRDQGERRGHARGVGQVAPPIAKAREQLAPRLLLASTLDDHRAARLRAGGGAGLRPGGGNIGAGLRPGSGAGRRRAGGGIAPGCSRLARRARCGALGSNGPGDLLGDNGPGGLLGDPFPVRMIFFHVDLHLPLWNRLLSKPGKTKGAADRTADRASRMR